MTRSRTLLILLAAVGLLLILPGLAFADPPPAHQYIRAYTGPDTCNTCHIGIADQVIHSVHYTWAEKMGHYSPLPGTTAAIDWLGVLNPELGIAGGCGRCHIGGGPIPGSPADDAAAKAHVDCLVCHAEVYDMNQRFPVQDEAGNWTIPGDSSLLAARTATRPTTAMCLRCHLNTGGSQLAQRSSDFAPVADQHAAVSGDVHIDRGMSCVDCHRAPDHLFYGYAPTLWGRDRADDRLACADCHTPAPHQDTVLNRHQRLDCRTCHILSTGGLVERDWTAPPQRDPITELYYPADRFAAADGIAPAFYWFNGDRLVYGQPLPGAYADLNSKVQPFKDLDATVPVDTRSGAPIPLKLDVYYTTGDLEQALRAGAIAAQMNYSGQWRAETITIPKQLSHGVTAKEQALNCVDCHLPDGRMDFAALGYSPDRVELLQAISHQSQTASPGLRIDIPNPSASAAPLERTPAETPAQVVFFDQFTRWSLWGALVILAMVVGFVAWLLDRQRRRWLG